MRKGIPCHSEQEEVAKPKPLHCFDNKKQNNKNNKKQNNLVIGGKRREKQTTKQTLNYGEQMDDYQRRVREMG